MSNIDRETVEAWIRGIESGLWNPTPAMKLALAEVLKDHIGPPPGLKTHSHYDWCKHDEHYGPCQRPTRVQEHSWRASYQPEAGE